MIWTRKHTIGIAPTNCSACFGEGLVRRHNRVKPCECVLRRIFDLCTTFYFQAEVILEGHINTTRIPHAPEWGPDQRLQQLADYRADYLAVTRRALRCPELRSIWHRYFLLSTPWQAFNRGKDVFHDIYKIKRIAGRAYAELKPFALYPVEDYLTVPHAGKIEPQVIEFKTPVRRPLMAPLVRRAA